MTTTEHNIHNNNPTTHKNQTTLYDFPSQGIGKWRVQDDVVMGGRSDSHLKLTEKKNAHFSGKVSLENNGGFCSIHQSLDNDPYTLPENSKHFVLMVKGDGKKYNFRVRTPNGRHSYGYTFSTQNDGDWETIEIPFTKMEAKFHGEPVEVPNYAGENVVEMQLLIGNKKEEKFKILIKSIAIK